MLGKVSLAVALLGLATLTAAEFEPKRGRDGKLLSVFNIVRFPNEACGGNSNQNGTCYTEQECENRKGTSQGSCASGYGVCCVFALNCGAQSSENNTYFESTGSEIGACGLKVCKCNDNICQLRLDFNTFQIVGPSTLSASSVVNFQVLPSGTSTRCLTDTFSVTNPGGVAPPSICGTNTGEHMYVDADAGCNDLIFQLGQDAIGTATTNRQWNIKITQYSCDYENLAPAGCTQYFFGSNTGVLTHYNSQGGIHLNNQNQNMCIRRERGQCRVCYFLTDEDTDFLISAKTTKAGFTLSSKCCGYGTSAVATSGYDCITIPGALHYTTAGAATKMTLKGGEQFCGRTLNTANNGMKKTICTDRVPFNIRFLSDDYDTTDESKMVDNGFRINYEMTSC